MKVRLFAAFCFLILASFTNAASVGVGVSIREDERELYVPVVFNSIVIEPHFSYSKNKENHKAPNDTDSYDVEGRVLGIGVFYANEVIDKVGVYYGIRCGYIEEKYTHKYSYLDSTNTIKTDRSGYEFSPVLGASYFVSPKFSIALEADLTYYKLKVDGKHDIRSGSTSYEDNLSGTESNTRLVVRVLF